MPRQTSPCVFVVPAWLATSRGQSGQVAMQATALKRSRLSHCRTPAAKYCLDAFVQPITHHCARLRGVLFGRHHTSLAFLTPLRRRCRRPLIPSITLHPTNDVGHRHLPASEKDDFCSFRFAQRSRDPALHNFEFSPYCT